MIARWRDQLDRQIIVFVAFYVGNKKFPQKLLSRWRRLSTSSSSWTAPRPPGRRSSPCTLGSSQDGAGCLLPPLLGLLPVLQEGVVVLALWDVLGSITLLGDLVVDKSELATLLSGRDSVQADVELSTVVRVRVLGVGVELTELISRSLLGTSEPVVGLVSVSLAVLPVGDLGPVADTAVL